MTTLKEAIKEYHDLAETNSFSKKLFDGKITNKEYATYLFNQMICYSALESRIKELGLISENEYSVFRANLLAEDYLELEEYSIILQSTISYCNYVATVPRSQLLAHLYVRHFGDLYGGQLLKEKVPGSARIYNFENRAELIKNLREKLTDDLAEEAKRVFLFVNDSLNELTYEFRLQ